MDILTDIMDNPTVLNANKGKFFSIEKNAVSLMPTLGIDYKAPYQKDIDKLAALNAFVDANNLITKPVVDPATDIKVRLASPFMSKIYDLAYTNSNVESLLLSNEIKDFCANYEYLLANEPSKKINSIFKDIAIFTWHPMSNRLPLATTARIDFLQRVANTYELTDLVEVTTQFEVV